MARSMWCRMSFSAATVGLKGINGVCRHSRSDIGLQPALAYYVDRAVEKVGNVFLQSDVIEHRHAPLRFDVDYDIEVAVRSAFAARHRAKHCGMTNTARPQGTFVPA